jgi:alkanesulfonate monooxygenase SsuD/methylene tetrahydromethanopterin reductase-like flavin-dependent oxidoreductase (luciferase family)
MTDPYDHPIPLSVLDLVPIASGSNAAEAVQHSIDLARRCERAGYQRYWFAEHHLNPGVAGTSPAVLISLVANATAHIRVGSAAVQMGHQTPLAVVEQFGLLDAVHPGRIDLGLGRSGLARSADRAAAAAPPPSAPAATTRTTERGLVVPPPYSFARLIGSPRIRAQAALLQQPEAVTPDYATQVADVLALLDGTYHDPHGTSVRAVPGTGADVQVWLFGSSGGVTAEVAGSNGLRFGANYHVAPSGVLDAVQAYRAAFRPSAELDRPYVTVSADVVVADTDDEARALASGYGLWVRSIRSGEGAIPFPDADEASRHEWTDDDRQLVQDRLDTQFVGSPSAVADRLEVLAAETGADELLITTITHRHADRVRSYELLADEWARRATHLRRPVTAGLSS